MTTYDRGALGRFAWICFLCWVATQPALGVIVIPLLVLYGMQLFYEAYLAPGRALEDAH